MTAAATHECTREQAEEITSRFRDAVGRVETAFNVVVTIAIDAFAHRVWIPLGYSTWDAYCAAEVDTAAARIPRDLRVQIVGQMSEAGMSTRAIGAAVGVDHKTVINDRARGGEISPPEPVVTFNRETGEVTGLDLDSPSDTDPWESIHDAPEPAPLTDEQCEAIEADRATVTGVDGKQYAASKPNLSPPKPRRKPYLEDLAGAVHDLQAATDRITQLMGDDRYRLNAEQATAENRDDLNRILNALHGVADRLA